MRAARIFLILMALMSLGLGTVYLVAPLAMTTTMGFGQLRPSALTDVRATYGGFQIGTGLLMAFCLRPDRLKVGMLLALLLSAAIAVSRAIGLTLDGEVIRPHLGALVFEILVALISFVIYWRTPERAAIAVPA